MMKSDVRYAALVAPCVLSPDLQAAQKPGAHWGYPFINLLMQKRINIVLLPCPEVSYGGYASGLQRSKHGINYYQALDGYVEYCLALAHNEAKKIQAMQAGGYQFLFSLGIEHSPTCAVNYMYSHKGMLKRSGLFWELLQCELRLHEIKMLQIGINRTHIQKSLNLVEQVLVHLDQR